MNNGIKDLTFWIHACVKLNSFDIMATTTLSTPKSTRAPMKTSLTSFTSSVSAPHIIQTSSNDYKINPLGIRSCPHTNSSLNLSDNSVLHRAFRSLHEHRRPITRHAHCNPNWKLSHYDYIPCKVVYKESVQIAKDKERAKLKRRLIKDEARRHKEAIELERQIMEVEGIDFEPPPLNPFRPVQRRGSFYFKATSEYEYSRKSSHSTQADSKLTLSPVPDTPSRPSTATSSDHQLPRIKNQQNTSQTIHSDPATKSTPSFPPIVRDMTTQRPRSMLPRPSLTTSGRLYQTIQLAVERNHTNQILSRAMSQASRQSSFTRGSTKCTIGEFYEAD